MDFCLPGNEGATATLQICKRQSACSSVFLLDGRDARAELKASVTATRVLCLPHVSTSPGGRERGSRGEPELAHAQGSPTGRRNPPHHHHLPSPTTASPRRRSRDRRSGDHHHQAPAPYIQPLLLCGPSIDGGDGGARGARRRDAAGRLAARRRRPLLRRRPPGPPRLVLPHRRRDRQRRAYTVPSSLPRPRPPVRAYVRS